VFGPQKYLDLEENFVDLDYRLLYSRYSESDSSPNEIKTFHSLAPKHDGLYLDWGCGGEWSPTITKLRAHGWDVWGYDPSASQSNPYVVNSRDSISARFDGIFSNNVIEHFRNPVRQFCQFHKMLKEGGKMSHSSPCYEYCYAFTRFHTLFLIGRSADILAERTGFKITNRVKDGEYINIVFERI
jgi:SAM-dependent methyltransferase